MKSRTQLKWLNTHICTMFSQWPTSTKGNGPSCLIPYYSWLHYTGQALLPLLFLDGFPWTYSHELLTHLFQVLAQMPFSQRRLSWPSYSTGIARQCYTPVEKAMATHFSTLAWKIPGTAEPGGLPSMGSHRVGHNWSDLAAAAAILHTLLCFSPWHLTLSNTHYNTLFTVCYPSYLTINILCVSLFHLLLNLLHFKQCLVHKHILRILVEWMNECWLYASYLSGHTYIYYLI